MTFEVKCIDDYLNDSDHPGDWVRIQLSRGGNGRDYFVMMEVNTLERLYVIPYDQVITKDTEYDIIPYGRFLFSITEVDGIWGGREWCVSFNPESYWVANGYLWDQHLTDTMETLFNIPSWIINDEGCENMFSVPLTYSRQTIISELTKAGLHHSQPQEDFIGPC